MIARLDLWVRRRVVEHHLCQLGVEPRDAARLLRWARRHRVSPETVELAVVTALRRARATG